MELNEIKSFLKIDFDDEDEYISLLIEVAIEYIEDSIGYFNLNRAKQRYLLLVLVRDMYESRSFTTDEVSEKVRYIVRSIVIQEQLGGNDE